MSSKSNQSINPPATMSHAELERVKVVAGNVAASSNPAKFQAELAQSTKNNFNFDFLRPEINRVQNPHHVYYNYCVKVYRDYLQKHQQPRANTQQHHQQQQQQQNRNRTAPQGGAPLLPTPGMDNKFTDSRVGAFAEHFS